METNRVFSSSDEINECGLVSDDRVELAPDPYRPHHEEGKEDPPLPQFGISPRAGRQGGKGCNI